jgi:hypothetical protein
MAGGMQPAPGARILPRTPAEGAVWFGCLAITDCQLHRSVTPSPKHSNVRMPKCQDVKVSLST